MRNAKVKIQNFSKSLKKNKLIVLPLLLVLAYLAFQTVTAQQAGQGLEVTPPSQEILTDPGETLTFKAKVRNRSNNTLPIKVRVEDFTAFGEQGQVELTEESSFSVKSWTKITPESFSLGPGEEREIIARVSVPDDAAGGRYGSFVFGISGEERPGSAALSQEIASLFLIRISGPVDERLSLTEFFAPRFSEFGPIPFSLKVKNSGNVYVKTYGLINVSDMFGRKVKDVVVYETNVFPGATRIIESTLDKKILIGKYTAIPILYYGSEQNQSLTASTTFYVFPLRIALILLLVVLVLFFGRKRIGKALGALIGR